MAFIHSPKIVTDGLILMLDAANIKSYPGSGTLWKDLSGRGTDFSVTPNAASFNRFAGGEIMINPIDNNTSITSSVAITTSTTCTVQMWMRINNDPIGILFGGTDHNNTYYGAYANSTVFYQSTGSSNTYHINAERFTGIPFGTITDNRYFFFETKNMNLSGRTPIANNWSNYVIAGSTSGSVAVVLLYDRNLTQAESLQNFNATRGRFGV